MKKYHNAIKKTIKEEELNKKIIENIKPV